MFFSCRNILFILFISVIFSNDGQGPLFTIITPSSDFFIGNSVQTDIQAIDQDDVEEVILYYRF